MRQSWRRSVLTVRPGGFVFARVVTVELRKGKVDEFARLFEDEWLPALRQAPGFEEASLFVNDEEQKVMGLVLWDSEAELDAFEEEFRSRAMKAALMVRRRPEGDRYQLRVKS